MNHDFKIQLLQAECLVILGIMGIVIVLLIIEYIRRCRKLNHSELVLHDAMGKFIYFINDDDDIDREILTGIRIEDDWNGHIAFFHEVPKDYRKRFIVTTASCLEFDLEAFGKEWFLTEDEAEAFRKAKR
ncbi:hypothetical protein MKC61_15320 [[Clostridium] innocuum]|nr:hypothetical protein [[Clostridium] innocuum]